MRRSVELLSMVFLTMTMVLAPLVWAADSVSLVNVAEKRAELTASAGVEKIRYFTLDSPKRLVVDLYGVQPGEHSRSFPLTDGFKALRVGPYEDKTRFVFDVAGSVFPTFNVNTENEQVVVTWHATQDVVRQVRSEPATVGSAQISAIDFASESGKSKLLINLNGTATATQPVRDGNKILFALKNSTLPRALRRSFDTLAFPSAIHSVVPYLVNVAGQPEVRFTVTLKDAVPYQLQKTANGYVFVVTDGEFATAAPAITGVLPVAVAGILPESAGSKLANNAAISSSPAPTAVIEATAADSSRYTGEKTSLVFDNADVRDILRLIAEISDLNIIASDDVKGQVTLRLIDVPWDQALELILDITGLGMLQEGNVVRVLPKSKIRTMKEAELTAVRSQEKLEPLVTEVVTVSYADLGSVAGPAKEVLSERGSITEDNRNKLLIVTDVPSRIQKVKDLINILDTPERQVMIEARIIEIDTDYTRDLGINWGLDYSDPTSDSLQTVGVVGGGSFLLSDTTVGTAGLGAGLRFGNSLISNSILNLRISALETDRKLKIISQPRVTTLNGEEATITQGTQVPTIVLDDSGNPTTEWKDVTLELKVTPVINPDGSIILQIDAKNDSQVPNSDAINKKSASTKVLVMDGETTVLGGVFIETSGSSGSGVPFLKDIPGLGHLFKSRQKTTRKNELLIFVTPRILK